MLLRGTLDAIITYQTDSSMDRPKGELSKSAKPLTLASPSVGIPSMDRRFGLLFRDSEKEATRYYKKTSLYPAQHTTIIRENIVKEHPWVVNNLMEAFERAKKINYERVYGNPPSALIFGVEQVRKQRETFGDDPHVYGIKANERMIDAAQTYSAEQGLTPGKQPWDEIFPEELLLVEENFGLRVR